MAKEAPQELVVNTIENIIKQTRGKFSPEDAVAATGYPIDTINSALQRLLELYRAKVSMNPKTGSLIFEFRYPLQKINRKTFKEVISNFLRSLWKIFTIIYKAAAGVILIFYTVLFILLIIAGILFSSSSDRDDNRGGNQVSFMLMGLIRGIFQALSFSAITNPVREYRDESGLVYKTYEKDKNKGTNFIQSVFSFVFGPERPKLDPNENAKEIISYIRKKSNGKLTAADIVLLSGVPYSIAEEKLAEYAAKFKGELSISEDGTIVADFSNLLNIQAKDLEGGRIVYYYNEIDPPAEHTGNSIGRNLIIIAMNAFNLFVSYSIVNSVQQPDVAGGMSPFLVFLLGYFPFVFSITFYLIPILRIPWTIAYSNKRKKIILRKKIFQAIFTLPETKVTFEQIANAINLPKELSDKAKHTLEKLVLDLRGEIEIGQDGSAIYNFEKVKTKLSFSRS
ncbi:MAG TPA: hypothetical protein PLC04_00150 [Candidatus Kapabacteria bacterium]|jgi:hypothetical protein|nr:hypothetical protein [Candidatus Kapabacteria bacterium]HOV91482.1 hypothetical protein [Candidatus Kapabacteria bacterium]